MRKNVFLFAVSLCASLASAATPEVKRVEAVEMLDKAVMYSKKPVHFGISCRTAPEGEIADLKQARIGDTVALGKRAFQIGVIEAVSFSEDLVAKDGRVLVRKGDVQCAMAANEKALPYDQKRCDALWVFSSRCRVVTP